MVTFLSISAQFKNTFVLTFRANRIMNKSVNCSTKRIEPQTFEKRNILNKPFGEFKKPVVSVLTSNLSFSV